MRRDRLIINYVTSVERVTNLFSDPWPDAANSVQIVQSNNSDDGPRVSTPPPPPPRYSLSSAAGESSDAAPTIDPCLRRGQTIYVLLLQYQ